MTGQLKYIVHGFWGARDETLERTSERIVKTFRTLTDVGVPPGGHWLTKYVHPVDVLSFDEVRRVVQDSPIVDDRGEPAEAEGYAPNFQLGDYEAPTSVAKEVAKLNVSSGRQRGAGDFLVGRVVLTLDGEALPALARERAREIVEGLVMAWQPDFLAFTDTRLLERRHARGSQGALPTWGHVAWLSDQVSRQLEHVDGASTARLGDGTLLQSDTWDPDQTADVWRQLLDSKRLRPAEPIQARLPISGADGDHE